MYPECLWTSWCNFIAAYLKTNSGEQSEGKNLSLHIFNPSPRQAADLLQKWFQPAYGAFFSLQKGVVHGNDLPLFLHGHSFETGWLNLGDSSMQDETLSPLLSSASRALYPYLLLALHDPIHIHLFFLAVNHFGACMSCSLLRVQCSMILIMSICSQGL